MNGEAQVLAYAQADFDQPHSIFITEFKRASPRVSINSHVLDLGCGTADISIRFAQTFDNCPIDALDGSQQMLIHAKQSIHKAGLSKRVRLFCNCLPQTNLPHNYYDVIISNSLLHHLHNPDVLWQSIKRLGMTGSQIFIMDLRRPASEKIARELVTTYAAEEPQILKDDFYHSLCAAFLPEDIQSQLQAAELSHLNIEVVSDRHVIIFGTL